MRYISLLAIAVATSALSALAPAADETFDSNGVKVRYVTEGEGEPIVLIHGWMGDSSMWGADSYGNTKLSHLDGFQIIAIDCRGHGKSDKPHEPQARLIVWGNWADDYIQSRAPCRAWNRHQLCLLGHL